MKSIKTQVIRSENSGHRANTSNATSTSLTEPNRIENEFPVPSQRFNDAIENGLKKTLIALGDELSNSTDGIWNSVN